jgi:hypothetical protein
LPVIRALAAKSGAVIVTERIPAFSAITLARAAAGVHVPQLPFPEINP